ncbi:TPM domain-containing protein [Niabella ginsengisoli]|uniref:TPM domain-containing protein n=1 Tax=Niabella ginsengisoli TaxID=522298 RepID=A0ABS9SNP7_9BACT|nr:TPM domain-containing protein [Niabella ginsengisoli]MCH5600000.1 TPM domain-containing protein [Niabella ginsengisoli]
MDSLVRNFEKSNLIPIKIVTIKDPSITAENFDQANKALLDEWSAVHGKSDKCMTISISKNLRRIRIDYGPFVTKLLSDTESSEIIESQFKPSFKEAQYYTGTFNGVTTLMNKIRKNIKF